MDPGKTGKHWSGPEKEPNRAKLRGLLTALWLVVLLERDCFSKSQVASSLTCYLPPWVITHHLTPSAAQTPIVQQHLPRFLPMDKFR